ncbi:hypothetical protein D6783_00420 [Candidatus Woesearchaeota archaeon]|nr:MAG: hypothetical protein D6783_00420 [Candidatus Woesearchaeota archaeon]
MEVSVLSAMDGWRVVLEHIIQNGVVLKDQDGRLCREVLHCVLTIEDVSRGLEEPMELLARSSKWVYPRKEELAYVMRARKEKSAYEYMYGPRIFSFRGQCNQLDEFIIPLLRASPTSRRAVVVLYDPFIDSRIGGGGSPGLVFLQFRVREGALFLSAVIRSNDMFMGWPANVVQLGMVQEYVAENLGVQRGGITTVSMSAHVYEENVGDVAAVLAGKVP